MQEGPTPAKEGRLLNEHVEDEVYLDVCCERQPSCLPDYVTSALDFFLSSTLLLNALVHNEVLEEPSEDMVPASGQTTYTVSQSVSQSKSE